MTKHYEPDNETFPAPAYAVRGYQGIAWHVLGWQTVPDSDTDWTGYEQRTGRVTCVMVGDDRHFHFNEDDLTPIAREDYCGSCGQIGCPHG